MVYFPRRNSKTQTLTRNQSTVSTEPSCVSTAAAIITNTNIPAVKEASCIYIAITSATISGWGLTSRGLTNCYRITISGSWGILLAYTRLKPIGPITHNCTYNIFHTSYFALATFLTHKNVISIEFLSPQRCS